MKTLRVFFLLFLVLPAALSAQRPMGPVFEVNDEHVGAQQLPHVAMNARGDFVVTWLHNRAQDRSYSLYASRFEPDGTPATGDILVTDMAIITEMNAEVAVMEDGSFVVVFPQATGFLKARSFGPDGTLEGESVLSDHAFPSFAVATHGNGFVLAWISLESEVFVRGFNASGEPVGPARRIGRGALPSLAVGPGGDFVVTWIASQPIPEEPRYSYQYLLAQRFGANGAPRGERIVVRAKAAFTAFPKVAKDGAGNFLVVWREPFNGFTEERLYARRYAADGSPLGGVLVLDKEDGRAEGPQLAMDRAGNFVVAWTQIDFAASGRSDVFARRFNAEGVPLRPAFQVSRGRGGWVPRLAGDANGNFVVVWQGPDGFANGVFARRFSRR